MTDHARARKLADRIKVVVAEALEGQVKDPRLGFVTVTDARVTGDLRDATVFYTVLGDGEARRRSAAALESAKGVLRAEVGRQTQVRHTPSLTFVADAIPEGVDRIEELLARARQADAEVQRVAAGATPAGEADPYRKPHTDAEDAEDAPDGSDGSDGSDAEDPGGEADAAARAAAATDGGTA